MKPPRWPRFFAASSSIPPPMASVLFSPPMRPICPKKPPNPGWCCSFTGGRTSFCQSSYWIPTISSKHWRRRTWSHKHRLARQRLWSWPRPGCTTVSTITRPAAHASPPVSPLSPRACSKLVRQRRRSSVLSLGLPSTRHHHTLLSAIAGGRIKAVFLDSQTWKPTEPLSLPPTFPLRSLMLFMPHAPSAFAIFGSTACASSKMTAGLTGRRSPAPCSESTIDQPAPLRPRSPRAAHHLGFFPLLPPERDPDMSPSLPSALDFV